MGLSPENSLIYLHMEKIYTCVGCSRTFKVTDDPTKSASRQHKTEMNVECPFCGKINAIVWPQHGFLLVLPTD
jgi:DNA-directed RNA polymerase subunit RPC12/RpoP